MNQLVIKFDDGSESVYAIGDTSVLVVDGQSVSLAGVASISLSDSPVEVIPAPDPAPATTDPAPPADPAPADQPAAAPEVTPDPSQPPAAPEVQQ